MKVDNSTRVPFNVDVLKKIINKELNSLLTIRHYAEMNNLAKETVRQRIKKGTLPYVLIDGIYFIMKPENLKKLEDTIKSMDSMYENQLKPYILISQQVGEAASFLVDRMNELIAIYNDEEGQV